MVIKSCIIIYSNITNIICSNMVKINCNNFLKIVSEHILGNINNENIQNTQWSHIGARYAVSWSASGIGSHLLVFQIFYLIDLIIICSFIACISCTSGLPSFCSIFVSNHFCLFVRLYILWFNVWHNILYHVYVLLAAHNCKLNLNCMYVVVFCLFVLCMCFFIFLGGVVFPY